MKQPKPSFSKVFLLLSSVSLLIPSSATLAGSAAQISSQVEILQDLSKSSQERSDAARELGIVGLDSDEAAQALKNAAENDSDAEVRRIASNMYNQIKFAD